jgi:hypothetical protein
MMAEEMTALQAHVNMLNPQTVRRVARLVLECRSSLAMVLLAVEDADRAVLELAAKQSCGGRKRGGMWGVIAAW